MDYDIRVTRAFWSGSSPTVHPKFHPSVQKGWVVWLGTTTRHVSGDLRNMLECVFAYFGGGFKRFRNEILHTASQVDSFFPLQGTILDDVYFV